MSSINRVILVGNVGGVDVKEFAEGRKLVQVSLATSSRIKKGDEWVDKTEWHRCIFSIPQLAERASSITKGDNIYVEGSISTNSWTTKDGEKKEMKEISCTSFTTFRKGAGSSNKAYEAKNGSVTASVMSEATNDDIPF